MTRFIAVFFFFFFNDPATTDIYTLSLHDALPISTTGPGTLGSISAAMALASAGLDGDSAPVLIGLCNQVERNRTSSSRRSFGFLATKERDMDTGGKTNNGRLSHSSRPAPAPNAPRQGLFEEFPHLGEK